MKNRTLIRIAWIHAALCAVFGIVIFLAHLIDSAAKGIVADLRPFLLTFGLIAFAAITANRLKALAEKSNAEEALLEAQMKAKKGGEA